MEEKRRNAMAEDEEELEEEEEEEEYSRGVGGTEDCWCKAVSGGTGVTVVGALWEAERVDVVEMEAALRQVQAAHPRLRSNLQWRGTPPTPFFSVAKEPFIKLRLVSESPPIPVHSDDDDDWPWLSLLESHLHTPPQWRLFSAASPPPSAAATATATATAAPLFLATLFHPLNSITTQPPLSLLILQIHTSICDRSSASSIVSHLLSFMSHKTEDDHHLLGSQVFDHGLSSMEDAIAPHLSSKPFWAHGLDILGYSLGSRRHATLPFQDVRHPRCSQIVLGNLPQEHTKKLIQECVSRKISMVGALTAASMKAVAKVKKLGSRGEHHAVVTMLDCRHLLEPPMSKSTIGNYQSAIMNTYYIEGEMMDFGDFARKCTTTLERAIANRKHFTDMGDLGLLMCQAMQMPHLTPSSSLRTSTIVVFNNEKLYFNNDDGMDDQRHLYHDNLGFLGYTGCSSIHGVGPSIAIFDDFCQGCLRLTCVFPSPLHSRDQMQELLDNIISFLNFDDCGSI